MPLIEPVDRIDADGLGEVSTTAGPQVLSSSDWPDQGCLA
jgi:hypothetical protein